MADKAEMVAKAREAIARDMPQLFDELLPEFMQQYKDLIHTKLGQLGQPADKVEQVCRKYAHEEIPGFPFLENDKKDACVTELRGILGNEVLAVHAAMFYDVSLSAKLHAYLVAGRVIARELKEKVPSQLDELYDSQQKQLISDIVSPGEVGEAQAGILLERFEQKVKDTVTKELGITKH